MRMKTKRQPNYEAMPDVELFRLQVDNIEQQQKLAARIERIGQKVERMNVKGLRALWAQIRLGQLADQLARIERESERLASLSAIIEAVLDARETRIGNE